MATCDLDDTFENAWRLYRTAVWRTLRRVGVFDVNLEDTTQEVFLTAHRRWLDFRGESQRRTWLLGITINIGRNVIRRQKNPLNNGPQEEFFEPADPNASVACYEGSAASVQIQRLLDGLDPTSRELFTLICFAGMAVNEAAEALELNPRYAYFLYNKARASLAKAFSCAQQRAEWLLRWSTQSPTELESLLCNAKAGELQLDPSHWNRAISKLEAKVRVATDRPLRQQVQGSGETLWRFAHRLGVPESNLWAVMQRVVELAYIRWGEFCNNTSPRTWLMHLTIENSGSYRHPSKPCCDGSSAEANRLLQNLLDQLEDRARLAWVVVKYLGAHENVAAQLLGTSQDRAARLAVTAHSHLEQALAKHQAYCPMG